MLSINMQCLRHKIGQLEALVSDKFDIIAMCDHWLTDVEFEVLNIDNFNVAAHFSRCTPYGGVLVLVRNNVVYKTLDSISRLSIERECELCGILLCDFECIILSVYRSPGCDVAVFLETLGSALGSIIFGDKVLVISGDFNVDFTKMDSGAAMVCDFLAGYGLSRTVEFSTRYDACIDNVFADQRFEYFATTQVRSGLSDHHGIHSTFRCIGSTVTDRPARLIRPITENGRNIFFCYFM